MGKKGTLDKHPLKEKDRRPIRWRKYPYLFLIVCEDQNTEPYYFETFIPEFPEGTVFLRAIGTGRSSKGVVEQAVKEREKLIIEANKDVDEVWAVFDKDDAEKSPGNTLRFIDAFKIARDEKIRVAYSNEVFELWLLLHFVEINTTNPIPRAKIYTDLEAIIRTFRSHTNFTYEHGKTEVIKAIKENGNEQKAIAEAVRIFDEHNAKGNHPINANPSTTVHILVKRLRELINWYSYTPE